MSIKFPALSIIVPIYNVEQYLPVCLNSLLSQSFENYELILIDDGSRDASGKICDDYAAKDSRIRVFHKKNEGVSVARNFGIEKAVGDWIYFADSDDELLPECLMLLTSRIKEGVDIIEGRYLPIGTTKPSLFPRFQKADEIYAKDEYLYRLYRYQLKQYHGYLWNKIFRAKVIKDYGLRFHTDIYFKEDGLFILEFVCKMHHNVLYFHDLLYLYYKRDSGMMKTYLRNVSPKSMSHLLAVNLMYEGLQSQSPSLKLKIAAKDEICRSYRILRKAKADSQMEKEMLSLLKRHTSIPYYAFYCVRKGLCKILGFRN